MKFIKWVLLYLLALSGDRKAHSALIAKQINACFDGIRLTRQTFTINGNTIKSSSGERVFYEAEQVDRAIKNLNDLINSLWRE